MHSPFVRSTESKLILSEQLVKENTDVFDANYHKYKLHVELDCSVKDLVAGVPLVKIHLSFDGCPTIMLSL